MKLVALTGSPGSGKSTVLGILGRKGYPVLPETYRWLKVLEAIDVFDPKRPDSNLEALLGLEAYRMDSEGVDYAFADRTVVDMVAYLSFYSELHREYVERFGRVAKSMSRHVALAFLFPIPESMDRDWLRREDVTEARSLYALIEMSYAQYDVECVRLERGEPNALAEQILLECNQRGITMCSTSSDPERLE